MLASLTLPARPFVPLVGIERPRQHRYHRGTRVYPSKKKNRNVRTRPTIPSLDKVVKAFFTGEQMAYIATKCLLTWMLTYSLLNWLYYRDIRKRNDKDT